MDRLSIPRFGFAIGVASAVAYAGCVFVMMTFPQDTAIWFFNSLMHGVDMTSIMRWDIPVWETILGIVETFVLGWLFGALVACCYNTFGKSCTPKPHDALAEQATD